MVDLLTRESRSRLMSRVRTKNTAPELRTRRLLHRLGFRYRLHRSDLPGRPDIVFTSRRIAIFVHGCFWHQHRSCPKAKLPTTRALWWKEKLQSNVARDARSRAALRKLGWSVVTIWECDLKSEGKVSEKLRRILTKSANEDG